jgi:hypothetical protein
MDLLASTTISSVVLLAAVPKGSPLIISTVVRPCCRASKTTVLGGPIGSITILFTPTVARTNTPTNCTDGSLVLARPPEAENTSRSPTFTDNEGTQSFASSISISRVIATVQHWRAS